MAGNNAAPQLTEDMTQNLAEEPALTIGVIFGDKIMLKTYIAAILALVATGTRLAVDDALIDNVSTVVQLVFLIATPFIAQKEKQGLATQQALVTRGAVWSPSSVSDVAEEAAVTGQVPTRAGILPDTPDVVTEMKKGPGV